MIKIGLIEDNFSLRKNYEMFFNNCKDASLLFSFHSIEQFLSEHGKIKQSPFLIFIDIGLPGISGLDGIGIINKVYPDTHLVILSGIDDEEIIWKAILKGAKSYMIKPVSFNQILAQIESIKEGGVLISPEVAKILVAKISVSGGIPPVTTTVKGLTPREQEVLDNLLKGFSYKQVAAVMAISTATVNDYIKRIYKKLEVNSKTELMAKILHQ
jgi:DNA-binding NarL/FixJ family response regulator